MRAGVPRGITLLEMMVVVALTLLIMAIMAQVIQLATGALSDLKAAQALLQQARRVEETIRLDLQSRTVRFVAPPVERRRRWHPGPDGGAGRVGFDDDGDGQIDNLTELGSPGSDDIPFEFTVPVGIEPRDNLGYFMIEENSPADEQGEDGDDVLAFTVRYQESGARGPFPGGFIGRAVPGSEPDNAFPPAGDGIAGSPWAEVIYFLRGNVLYRRLLLVGTPQPSKNFYEPKFSWYAQYDISARPPEPWDSSGVPRVNTLGDLTYRSSRFGMTAPQGYLQRGLTADSPWDPLFPFGPFDPEKIPNLSYVNIPSLQHPWGGVQHDTLDHSSVVLDSPWDNRPSGGGSRYPVGAPENPPVGEIWWGRPLMRETAATNWDYPNRFDGGPWTPTIRQELMNTGGLRRFDPTSPPNLTEPLKRLRAAEDVLAVGVLSFDVKVWDPAGGVFTFEEVLKGSVGPGAFVDLGYALEDYLVASPGNGPFGSLGPPPGPLPSLGLTGGLGATGGRGQLTQHLIAPRPFPLPFEKQMPPFGPTNLRWPPEPGAAWYPGFGNPWQGFNGQREPYLETMSPAPRCLWRTYDTWCTAYTRTYRTVNGQVRLEGVAPPYVTPIRAVQVKIRFVEQTTGLTRELTIVEELR